MEREPPYGQDLTSESGDEDNNSRTNNFRISGSDLSERSSRPNRGQNAIDTNFNNVLNSEGFLWGYEAHRQRYGGSAPRDERYHVMRAKLMLVTSEHVRQDREVLRPKLKYLLRNEIIRQHGGVIEGIENRDVQDVISDFLTCVLAHTKQQLIDIEGLTNEDTVSFAITVPAIWSSESSRVMQSAMEVAMKATSFGTLTHGSIDNLFIVSEPEAAATYLLGSQHNMLVRKSAYLSRNDA
jgi:hypothetical protein